MYGKSVNTNYIPVRGFTKSVGLKDLGVFRNGVSDSTHTEKHTLQFYSLTVTNLLLQW